MMTISKERLEAIERIADGAIDYSDIPELGDDFWDKAELRLPSSKQAIYIRLDRDMLEWFKAQGKGYQTRINQVLRSYYEAVQRH